MRLAIFGDVGGHAGVFAKGLRQLGVKNGYIPDDLIVLQMGDLIHKGVNSEMIVSRVDELMKNNPGQWLQLMGNHEFMHLKNSCPPFWRCHCSENLIRTLQKWHHHGYMRVAHYLHDVLAPEETIKRDVLFTHAGLSRYFLSLDAATNDVESIATTLNNLSLTFLHNPGLAMYPKLNFKASPVWITALPELYTTWTSRFNQEQYSDYSQRALDLSLIADDPTPMPFHQFHGHSFLTNWDRVPGVRIKEYRQWMGIPVELNPVDRRTKYRPQENGGAFYGVDPGWMFKIPRDVVLQPYTVISY